MNTKHFYELTEHERIADFLLDEMVGNPRINKRCSKFNRCLLSLRHAKRCRKRVRQFYSPSSQFALKNYRRHLLNFYAIYSTI